MTYNNKPPLSNNIWDQPNYPWGQDLNRDMLKQEYDKRLEREQGNRLAGQITLNSELKSSDMVIQLKKRQALLQQTQYNQPPVANETLNNTQGSANVNNMNTNSQTSSISPAILDLAEESIGRPTPFASRPNPKTTVSLSDTFKADSKINPFLNTATEQQTYNHYLGGSGKDIAFTDAMFKRAANYAQQKLGTNLSDGSKTVSFYGSKEFNGTLGKAKVYVKNGKVIGLYDYYNFDRKPWFGENRRDSRLAEFATWLGNDPKGRPFRIYGGMVKKRY